MHVPIREFQRGWEEMSKGEFLGEGGFAKKPEPGSGFLGVMVEENEKGEIEVKELFPKSVAEKAGIKVGAILLEIDGKALADKNSFYEALNTKGVEGFVLLRWSFQEEVFEKKIELAERP